MLPADFLTGTATDRLVIEYARGGRGNPSSRD